MVARVNKPGNRTRRVVSYALMRRFSDLLLCGRCFRKQVHKPIRQLVSKHHRPLTLCHQCSHEAHAEHSARVIRFN